MKINNNSEFIDSLVLFLVFVLMHPIFSNQSLIIPNPLLIHIVNKSVK